MFFLGAGCEKVICVGHCRHYRRTHDCRAQSIQYQKPKLESFSARLIVPVGATSLEKPTVVKPRK